MHRHKLILILILLISAIAIAADTIAFNGCVLRVFDGDTVLVGVAEIPENAPPEIKPLFIPDNSSIKANAKIKYRIKIRLYGIDAPEQGQDYATRATEYLAFIIGGRNLKVVTECECSYDRLVAKLFLGKEDISLKMLLAGMAWHYSYYDKSEIYRKAEKNARISRTGLWAAPNPIPPYYYRKNHKKQKSSGKTKNN